MKYKIGNRVRIKSLGDVGEYICNMPSTMDIDCNKYDLNTIQVSQKIIKIKATK